MSGVCLSILLILSTRTKVWETASQEEFLKGTSEGVAVAPEGVMLGPSLKEVARVDEPYIWALAQDRRGRVYLGTGDEGRLYRVERDGRLSLIYDAPGTQLTVILVAGSDSLYVGSAPDGVVYKVTPQGDVREFFRSGERYIWGLAVDPSNNIYCATGELGRLYKLSPDDGSPERVYEPPAPHILSLLWADGLYFGTQTGVVYRLKRGDLRVIYEAHQPEVQSLRVDHSDRLWFAANPDYQEEESPLRPGVYRVSPDGITEPIWTPPDSFIFALAPVADGMLVATGNEGRLYRVSNRGEATLLAQLDAPQVTCLAGDGQVWLATANPAILYRMGEGYTQAGSLLSRVFDAATTARWGRLDWEGVVPKGAKIEFKTRSGHTSEPDETWSDWEPLIGEKVQSPPARFLQWRADLSSSSSSTTPLLRQVSVAYQEANLAPRVAWVRTGPGERQSRTELKISWEASDPNQDSLVVDLYFKGLAEERWKTLKLGVEGEKYILDTQALPDGHYQVKVVASDRPDNPGGLAREGEMVSRPFILDNTPPQVEGLRAQRIRDGSYRISFTAEDGLSRIGRASYSVNGGEWCPLSPTDLIFDGLKEEFLFELELKPGEYTVVVKAVDDPGNSGLGKLIIRR